MAADRFNGRCCAADDLQSRLDPPGIEARFNAG